MVLDLSVGWPSFDRTNQPQKLQAKFYATFGNRPRDLSLATNLAEQPPDAHNEPFRFPHLAA
jgi:hypothetical protein